MPRLVELLLRESSPGPSVTVLNAELQKRDHKIAELRESLRAAEEDRDIALV